jgi:RND family efflux transporter MFP subunit
MAHQRSGFAVSTAEFAAALLMEREVGPRAQLTAEQCIQLIPDGAVVVYVIPNPDRPFWTPRATAGDIHPAGQVEFGAGTLGEIGAGRTTTVMRGRELRREDYAHLDVRRTVTSLAYVPLLSGEAVVGAIELVHYEQVFPESVLAPLQEIAELTSPAIASALLYERERNATLHSISRVTQMYDLEKVFNATIELEPLLQLIADKFKEVLESRAVNVWMVDNDAVRLFSRAGNDPTAELEATQRPGEGVAGDVSDTGEAVLIANAADERLRQRNTGRPEGAIVSLLAAPLMDRGSLVGVVEAINRSDGLPFDEEDEFLLVNMCETASNALHNASLLQAERKVEILETLVTVSQQITSTLDLDRVLQAITNGTQAIVSYDRAAIALEARGTLQLRAVSGMTQINFSDPTIKLLKEMLEWASISNDEVHVTQHGDVIDVSREASRAKFAEYFSITEARAFYALPLNDDQGRLGILSFESRDPDFLTRAHVEVIRVLAAQATVALRNASLYREVPFISLLGPVLEQKRKFLALERRRRATIMTVAAGFVLFLIFFPVPMRLAGDAAVSPVRKSEVTPAIEGVVKTVLVHEGDPVRAGTVLADLEDWDYRATLATAQAKYQIAMSEMSRALALNDDTEAGTQRVQADYWASEVSRARERLDRVHLRSPIDGVVATPHVENLVGRHLSPTDAPIEIVDTAQSSVDVAIDEPDVALLGSGERAVVKLDSFPTRSFEGKVQVVSPVSALEGDEKVFFARVLIPNPDGLIRDGMHGRGKIMVRWRPAGYVLFRRPAMWLYSKLWSWLGW